MSEISDERLKELASIPTVAGDPPTYDLARECVRLREENRKLKESVHAAITYADQIWAWGDA